MNFLKNSNFCKTAIFTLFICTASYAQAGFWSWTKPFVGPDQKISTLIVTGNYANSRMLAELIQESNRQPILLVPSTGGEDGIYFIPPKNREKALKVPFNELTNFVNFAAAKQIIILGDNRYVPDKYTDEISNVQTVCKITSSNWNNIAYTVGKFLNLPNLASDYKNLYDKMKSEVNYVRSNKDVPEEPQELANDNSLPELPNIEPDNKANEPIIIDASQK